MEIVQIMEKKGPLMVACALGRVHAPRLAITKTGIKYTVNHLGIDLSNY
jgi:hypothetical protein